MFRRVSLLLLLPACIVIHDDNREPDDLNSVVIDGDCPGEPAWVTSATIDGNDLVVDVGYGGCHEANVWACWDGEIAESAPPQVWIEIHHGESGDCDAAFETTARFHLDAVIDRVGGSFLAHLGEQMVRWDP